MTTSWKILSGCERTPCTCDLTTHHEYREGVMMAVEEAAGVRGQRAQRKCVIHGNIRAKLSNYIGQVFECKADSPHYSRRFIATRTETRQRSRNERLVARDNHPLVRCSPGATDIS